MSVTRLREALTASVVDVRGGAEFRTVWESTITLVNLSGLRLLELAGDRAIDPAETVQLQVTMMGRVTRTLGPAAAYRFPGPALQELTGWHQLLASTGRLQEITGFLCLVPGIMDDFGTWAAVRGADTALREAFGTVTRSGELMRECVTAIPHLTPAHSAGQVPSRGGRG